MTTTPFDELSNREIRLIASYWLGAAKVDLAKIPHVIDAPITAATATTLGIAGNQTTNVPANAVVEVDIGANRSVRLTVQASTHAQGTTTLTFASAHGIADAVGKTLTSITATNQTMNSVNQDVGKARESLECLYYKKNWTD